MQFHEYGYRDVTQPTPCLPRVHIQLKLIGIITKKKTEKKHRFLSPKNVAKKTIVTSQALSRPIVNAPLLELAHREILSNKTEIRLYLPYFDWFEKENGHCPFAVPNQSIYVKYNQILYWFNKISKRFLGNAVTESINGINV